MAGKSESHNCRTARGRKISGKFCSEMVRALPFSSSHFLFSPSLPSYSRRSSSTSFSLHRSNRTPTLSGGGTGYVRCEAAPSAVTLSDSKTKEKPRGRDYQIENLTTWLIKQEQLGTIDAELTIVLSSISLACKQIASLLQRSSIVNLTGGQGTINIQGEDQKKLDVISNEV